MHHQAQQSHAVMQNKSLIYGDPCESGYSTTASSEEGTLQRGFTKKQNGGFESESFLNNPKFLEMVSRSKGCDYSYSPASSHGSADSPLAFGIPDHIPATIDAFRHVDDVTSVDEINVAALQKFKDNLENIRTYQTAKPQKPAFSYYDPLHIADVPQGKTTKSTSPSSKCGSPQKPIPMRRSQNKHRGPINFSSEAPKTVETSIKSISPTADHKSAFVVVKPRVIHRPSPTESKPLAYQHTCSHDTCEKSNPLPAVRPRKTTERIPTLSPIDNSIVYIPAQIDENGIARPVESRSSKRMCARNKKNSNRNEVAGDEAARLREYLEKAEAKDLKYALEKLLKSKDPNSIEAMTKLFPTNKKPEASHCLRCHKDFNPNEPGRCILPHPEKMVTKVSQDSIGADFVCGCCDARFRLIQMDFYEESTNAFLTGHCFSGSHTTDPSHVDYRSKRGAAKSCADSGCVELYV